MTLLYHNHDWEFRANGHIWNRIQNADIEALGYAPDLGWAVKGGRDMAQLLDEIGSHIKVLHFKDFLSWDGDQDTCHLGTGVIDFAPAWHWLRKQMENDIWITAEQDNAEDNESACEANGAYLGAHLSELRAL